MLPSAPLATLLSRATERCGRGRAFPLVIGIAAFLATVSVSVPVTGILVPAALVGSARLRRVVVAGALGSGLGATALMFLFHHLGWTQVHAWFPHLTETPHWQEMVAWTARYGVAALFAIAALPLPQTPSIAFLAMTRPEALPVFFAIVAGKLVKYSVVCGLAVRVHALTIPADGSGNRTDEKPD